MFRRSPKFQKLKFSMKYNVPTQSEIRSELGTDLAEVVFDYSHNETKKLLGLIPLLRGIQEDVWISPENQIDNNIVLTPVEDNQILKACTHKAILAIGDKLLKLFKQEIEEQVRQKLSEDFIKKGYMFDAEKRRAVQLAEQNLHTQFECFLTRLYKKFEDTLQVEINKVQEKCDKNQQIAVVQERMRVTHDMLTKLRKEVSYIITSVYDELDQMYRAQRENMISDFNEIMRREHVKLNERVQEIKRKKNEALETQYHQLLLQYMSNVVYISCTERHRSCTEKQKLYEHFQDKIRAIKIEMAEHKAMMCMMKQEVREKKKDKRVLEENLRTIIEEFKKLISFTLHSTPEETEFLETFKSVFLPDPEKTEQIDSESMDERIVHSKYHHRHQVQETLNKHLRKQCSKSSSIVTQDADQVCLMELEERSKLSSVSCTCSTDTSSGGSSKSLNPCRSLPVNVNSDLVCPSPSKQCSSDVSCPSASKQCSSNVSCPLPSKPCSSDVSCPSQSKQCSSDVSCPSQSKQCSSDVSCTSPSKQCSSDVSCPSSNEHSSSNVACLSVSEPCASKEESDTICTQCN